MDLCAPSKTHSTTSKLYFMLIIDDFSRMMWVPFLKEESRDFEKFKEFKVMDQNETNCKIKSIGSDNGDEFT